MTSKEIVETEDGMETEDDVEPDIRSVLTKAQLDAVSIDDVALDEELMKAPGDIAYWNALFTDALRSYLLEKHECAIVRAKARLRIKADTLKDKTTKYTVDDINALLDTDDVVSEADIKLVHAEATKDKYKKFAEAVVAKKDMLQSLGAKLREEMRGDPVIRNLHRSSREQ